jgi:hypothetical protein
VRKSATVIRLELTPVNVVKVSVPNLIIDYYKLRFQIEFNFRDAKQFWGLEDFMNLSLTAVTNAVNLAFFILSHHLLADFRLLNGTRKSPFLRGATAPLRFPDLSQVAWI